LLNVEESSVSTVTENSKSSGSNARAAKEIIPEKNSTSSECPEKAPDAIVGVVSGKAKSLSRQSSEDNNTKGV
jgi:hypothetical protein